MFLWLSLTFLYLYTIRYQDIVDIEFFFCPLSTLTTDKYLLTLILELPSSPL